MYGHVGGSLRPPLSSATTPVVPRRITHARIHSRHGWFGLLTRENLGSGEAQGQSVPGPSGNFRHPSVSDLATRNTGLWKETR